MISTISITAFATRPRHPATVRTSSPTPHDVSASGAAVVGTIAIPGEGYEYHAIVWEPNFADGNGPHSVVFLPDDPEDIGFNEFDYGIGSWAYDIDAAGASIVGSVYIDQDVCQDGCFEDRFIPVIWTGATPDWTAHALPTLLDTEVKEVDGEAYAINDAGTYAAGWSGVEEEYWYAPNAVRWTIDTATPENSLIERLTVPDDGDLTEYGTDSVANDISADGKVIVGWIGDGSAMDRGQDDGLYYGGGPTLPVVWVDDGTSSTDAAGNPVIGTIIGLQLATDDDIGDARAVNAAGDVAVGWSGQLIRPTSVPLAAPLVAPEDLAYRAMLWQTSDGWATHTATMLGGIDPIPALFDGEDPEIAPVTRGSVANAVDASGTVVVGQIDIDDGYGNNGIWSEAAIWQASGGFAGSLVQTELENRGVTLKPNFYLTTATGVRTLSNAEGYTDIIIIGDGEYSGEFQMERYAGADPAWLVRLTEDEGPDGPEPPPPPPPPGITTPDEQITSITDLGKLFKEVTGSAGQPLFGLQQNACLRARGTTAAEQPWCFFAFGGITGYWDMVGTEVYGDVGMARYYTDVDSLGASIGLGHISVRSDSGLSSIEGTAPHVGFYASHMPDAGLQAFSALTLSVFQDLDITRAYANGMGTAQSFGSTDGWAYGLLGRLGYAQPLGPQFTLTPFAQFSYTATHFNGWTETGGPFPATFGAATIGALDLRLGAEGKFALTEQTTLIGSAAWAHRLSGAGSSLTGSLVVADCDGAAPIAAFCGLTGATGGISDWFEGSLGLRHQWNATTVTSITGTVGLAPGYTSAGIQIGFSKSF